MAPAQVLGDVGAVAQFNQVYNVMSQRRSEASLMLSDSFRWDNAILTNQGLPLVGMAFCLESHGHDESVESQQRSTYQRSEELDDELSWNPSTTRPGLVSERGRHSGHG
ncbi:hypothetical protein Trco_005092 [Trichoderma cornu-damae]|uniref:Uncharacterized protein n=1 Tax=Trichoderma cornu-damae TaxID=654480 RepID=A0A9P8QIT2_9HYPO|nr:hypothetical protein Trco_005092 [Trichoderma cornu-damae]